MCFLIYLPYGIQCLLTVLLFRDYWEPSTHTSSIQNSTASIKTSTAVYTSTDWKSVFLNVPGSGVNDDYVGNHLNGHNK